MKRLANYLIALALMAFTFTSCEDVPNPFGQILPPNGGGDEEVFVAEGNGTLADPYNVQGVLEYVTALGADVQSDKEVYVKGYVITIKEQFSSQYGNAQFTMSDSKEGGNTFTFYRGLYLGNQKWVDGNATLSEGDEVIVCGKVVNYKGTTPETVQNAAYVYSLNGKTEDGGNTPTPSETLGTKDAPLTVAQALEQINALADGGTTDKDAYVTGKITKIKTSDENIAKYKNIDYIISDGTNELTVFRGKNIDNTDFTEAGQINVGDEVVVFGKLTKYVNNGATTPEVAQGNYIVKLTKGSGGGDTPTPTGKGSVDNPYNITEALAAINALADNGYSDSEVYVKGKVVKVTTNQTNFEKYGNLNYLISEDGTDNGSTITVYSGDGLKGAKFTGIDALKQGDEVVVYGKLQKYVKNDNVTPEIAKGNYLYSLNGKTEEGGGSAAKGSVENPYNISEALAAINALADNGYSDSEVYVKGKVVKVTTNQTNFEKYGNLNYLISEDGNESNTITVYSGDGLKGAKFTGIDALKQGDEVIVYGKLQKYVKNDKVTPEIAKGNYLYSLNGKTE